MQEPILGVSRIVEKPSGHAFISYVREDVHDVNRLQKILEAAGVSVWRDTADLWPGEDWRLKIRRAITDSAFIFIACFSSHSAARTKSYQNEELLLAVEQLRQRRPDVPWLIPVRFDDCPVPDLDLGGGRTLASIQRADLFGDHREVGITQLVTTVQRFLGQRPPDRVPPRHTRLLGDARDIAESITDKGLKAIALADVAGALAVTDPDSAEHIARSISGKDGETSALARIAGALAATDPDRANRLIADAEDIARSLSEIDGGSSALADIVRALAATDPYRAEPIAQSITDEGLKAIALADVARALAGTDPDRAARLIADAEDIARSFPYRAAFNIDWRSSTLAAVARALAIIDPDHAEHIAHSIGHEDQVASALAYIAGTLAITDPSRAEDIAQSIISEGPKAGALANVARKLAATDPDRANRLIADAERIAQSVTDNYERASALANVAGALAATDPDRANRLIANAERTARSITGYPQVMALAEVTEALAATDRYRAERIARSLSDAFCKVRALVAIAKA